MILVEGDDNLNSTAYYSYLGTNGFLAETSLICGPSCCVRKYRIPAMQFSTAASRWFWISSNLARFNSSKHALKASPQRRSRVSSSKQSLLHKLQEYMNHIIMNACKALTFPERSLSACTSFFHLSHYVKQVINYHENNLVKRNWISWKFLLSKGTM